MTKAMAAENIEFVARTAGGGELEAIAAENIEFVVRTAGGG